MIHTIVQILSPDHCYGCSKTGSALCLDCKYDIITEPFNGCIWCRKPNLDGSVCTSCSNVVDKGWAIGERSDVLRKMLDDYKFNHRRSLAQAFAELLDQTLPVLPPDTIVCELPTVRAHIRERSFDHTRLIASKLAKKRKLEHRSLLERINSERQYGSSRQDRLKQASRAFRSKQVDEPLTAHPVVLIDDVLTTGASLHYAAVELSKAGFTQIWVAIIARQPLDQTDKI